jgi:hypothetical protein
MQVQIVKRQIAHLVLKYKDHSVVHTCGGVLNRFGLKEGTAKFLFRRSRKSTVKRAQRIRHLQAKIDDDQRPIVVGPWLSEVGFEILYWIPFLRRMLEGIPPSRVTVVSRGGVSSWYDGIAARYVDIFQSFSPDEFRALNERRHRRNHGLQKHSAKTFFDGQVLSQLGVDPKSVIIHPELMYGLFDAYWSGSAGLDLITDNTRFSRFAIPPIENDGLVLPKEFTAIKFYSRPSFPRTATTDKFVRDFSLRLADRGPVVLLDPQIKADDHDSFEIPRHENIFTLNDHLNVANNLAVQSAVVARASRVYCTYGGFAYLPLLYGVPATGFFTSDKHFMKIHGRVAYWLASEMQTSLSVVDAAEWQ